MGRDDYIQSTRGDASVSTAGDGAGDPFGRWLECSPDLVEHDGADPHIREHQAILEPVVGNEYALRRAPAAPSLEVDGFEARISLAPMRWWFPIKPHSKALPPFAVKVVLNVFHPRFSERVEFEIGGSIQIVQAATVSELASALWIPVQGMNISADAQRLDFGDPGHISMRRNSMTDADDSGKLHFELVFKELQFDRPANGAVQLLFRIHDCHSREFSQSSLLAAVLYLPPIAVIREGKRHEAGLRCQHWALPADPRYALGVLNTKTAMAADCNLKGRKSKTHPEARQFYSQKVPGQDPSLASPEPPRAVDMLAKLSIGGVGAGPEGLLRPLGGASTLGPSYVNAHGAAVRGFEAPKSEDLPRYGATPPAATAAVKGLDGAPRFPDRGSAAAAPGFFPALQGTSMPMDHRAPYPPATQWGSVPHNAFMNERQAHSRRGVQEWDVHFVSDVYAPASGTASSRTGTAHTVMPGLSHSNARELEPYEFGVPLDPQPATPGPRPPPATPGGVSPADYPPGPVAGPWTPAGSSARPVRPPPPPEDQLADI